MYLYKFYFIYNILLHILFFIFNKIKRKFDPPISPTSTINVEDDEDDVKYIGTIARDQSEVNNGMTCLTTNFKQIPSMLVTPPQSPPEVEQTPIHNIHISHDPFSEFAVQDPQPRNDEMPTLRALLATNDVEQLNVPCFLCQMPFSDYESLRHHLGQHAAQLISLNSPYTVVSVPPTPPDNPLGLLPNYPLVSPQNFPQVSPPNYTLGPPPSYPIVAPADHLTASNPDFQRVPYPVLPGFLHSDLPRVPYPDVSRAPLPDNPRDSLPEEQRTPHADNSRVELQEEEVYPPDFLRVSLTHDPVVAPPSPTGTESVNPTCFRCNTCHKMLISKTSLLLHQNIHHKSLQQVVPPINQVAPTINQLNNGVRKPLRCTICKKGYKRDANLSKHILSRHRILPMKSRQENPEEPMPDEGQQRIVWSTNLLNAVAAADYNPATEKVEKYLPPDVRGSTLNKPRKQKYALRSPYCNPYVIQHKSVKLFGSNVSLIFSNLWINYDDHVP